MTNAAIKQLIAQGVADALAEIKANRTNRNGYNSHDLGTGSRMTDNCTVACLIKFATCTLLDSALTWWNSYVKTVGHDAAYGMPWKTLKKMMTSKYCPRELALMCGRMFLEESDEVEKYVGGLPDMIQKEYVGTLLLCNKCKFHHTGPCTVKCANCNRICHLTRDCKSPATISNQRTLTCYECGNQGHYRSDCPKLKNRNHGNQSEGAEARGMVYALGGRETDQDIDNIEDDINA
ncbi:reverse transcriptase domain-containing protein [Tanacetum coccineum]